ncbi:MAG: thiamine pyrophosphate-binding protein [Gammaproteobacteria bacterium]|nr:thiamine pyrophosphate-binding protein [Gammaproteobacteria bacterium]
MITVSKLIVRYMQRLGIDTIFGMPGAHILPVYDCLYDSDITTVLAKHEQGAAFMAGGYARASGRIGACITTAGPGATNLVTGVANAYVDKLPMLIITGETSTHIFGKGGLQESSGEGGSIDQSSLFKGITRYHSIIQRTDYLTNVLNRAAKILLSNNPGPVLLSFPFNLQQEMVDETLLDNIRTEKNIDASVGGAQVIARFADLLIEAKAPVIIAGYGCIHSGAEQQVAALSETMAIPVASSLKGKGIISEQSPLSLGSLGVTSYGPARDYIVEQADLLIILGAAFNERTSYVWDKDLLAQKRVVQVDYDEEQLEKVFTADLAIQGDIKAVLEAVSSRIQQQGVGPRVLDQLPEMLMDTDPNSDAGVFRHQFALVEAFFTCLETHFPQDMMLFDDNIIFAQNFFRVSAANTYYPNSGVSSLGHAIPAAIGARFAREQTVFAVLGDGGFQMCCMEIMTAVNYQIPITIIMFNNSTMGLIRKNQYQQYEERFINCDFINPDYEVLAQSFGIHYRRIETIDDIEPMFTSMDLTGSINLIEIMIDKDLFPGYISKR